MNFPLFLFLFLLPPLLYVARKTKRENSRKSRVKKLGFIKDKTQVPYLFIAIAFSAITIATVFLFRRLVDINFASIHHTVLVYYGSWEPHWDKILLCYFYELIYSAIGEEVLFRGYIGGKLFRKYGYIRGNITQTAIFLLPYLVYSLFDVTVLGYVPVMIIMSWLSGWLRYKSKSVFPSIILHMLTTGTVAVTLM